MTSPSPRKLTFPVGVLLGAGLVWAGVEFFSGDNQQALYLGRIGIALLSSVSLLIWAFFFSSFPRRTRLVLACFLALTLTALSISFEYLGVSGDLLPQFAWRWRETTRLEQISTIPADTPRGAFPGYLGLERNSKVDGIRLREDWETHQPQVIWKRSLGKAWSGFAVSGDFAVTQEQFGDDECVACYDLLSGRQLWISRFDATYASKLAGDGPRATPTIDRNLVFAMGATGQLSAHRLEDGETIWARQAFEENEAETPEWGASSSPLVQGDRVIVSAGGGDGRSLVAYDRLTGERVWSAGNDAASYASPFLAKFEDREEIVSFNAGSVTGHAPASGEILWTIDWQKKNPNCAQPLFLDDKTLLVSTGYGVGSRAFRFDGREPVLLWRSTRLKSKFASPIVHRGSIYGLDDGILTCIDASNGRRRWKSGRYGHGQVLAVGEHLLITSEEGAVVLVALDEEEHRELARFPVIEGKVWNPPALAGGLLLMRNDTEAALIALPTETTLQPR